MQQVPDFNQILQHFLKVITKQFFCVEGRMSRLDYIVFIIPALIIEYFLMVTVIGYIICLIPTGSAAARRLHDAGLPGWIALFMIIPAINIILTVVLCVLEGQKDKNEFGAVPADACLASK